MKKTDQQLITATRALISQTDSSNSDFTDSELLGYINDGVQYAATKVEWPRDHISIPAVLDTPAYTLPSDAMKIRNAYFGDQNISGDVVPLSLTTEEKLKEYQPGWLDKTSSADGRPSRIILLNKRTILVNPMPNSESSAAGKNIYLTYVYYPAALANNGGYPDLPDIYHEFIPEYALHMCYLGKLKRPDLSDVVLKTFLGKLLSVQVQATDEIDEKYFGWGNYEDSMSSKDRVAFHTF